MRNDKQESFNSDSIETKGRRIETTSIENISVDHDEEWLNVEGVVDKFLSLTEKQKSWIAKRGVLSDGTGEIEFTLPKDAVNSNESLNVKEGEKYLIEGVVGNAYDEEIHLKFTKKTNCSKVENDSSESLGGNTTDDSLRYALIHEVTSLTDYNELENPDSVESQVARGRGKGTVTQRKPAGENTENAEYNIRVTEGQLKVESGYVMRFVNEEHLSLSPFDVIGLDSVEAYVAPTELIENLSPRIRGYLNEYGYVKIRGAYSKATSQFYGVQLGWEKENDVDPWDRIMEVIDQVSSTPAAVDYTFVMDGPERWDVEEIAEARGIAESSVRGNVRGVSNELDS